MVPCSSSQAVDKSRIKTKDVYEGIYKASTRRKLHASMGANNVVQTLWATFHDANGLKLQMACMHTQASITASVQLYLDGGRHTCVV